MIPENNNHVIYPPQMMHQQTDEISLAELFSSVWEGKWLIAAVTAITVLFGGAYGFTQPQKAEISLKLKNLIDTSFLEYQYLNSTAKGFFEISKGMMFSLLVQELADNDKWISAVSKHKLISKDEYKNEEDFEKAIIDFSNEFEVIPPTAAEVKAKNIKKNWTIEYDGKYSEKELDVISDVLVSSTENVRIFLQKKFEQTKNLYVQKREFDLEELNDGIANQIAIYDQKTRNRIEFLTEQAQIARTLGIQKNTIEAQTFKSTNTVVANVKSDNSFYLRGYEAIEKEIELLKSRSVKEAHIPELIDLYNKRRILEQDKTIARVQVAFDATPIVLGDFKAVEYDLRSAEIESKNKTKLILALSVVLGGMLGLFVLLVQNAVRKVKIKES